MGLSWGRRSAARPVSSPVRQDKCKVGLKRGRKRGSKTEKLPHKETGGKKQIQWSKPMEECVKNVRTRFRFGDTKAGEKNKMSNE